MNSTILVVDDDYKTVDLIRIYLEKDGYRILTAYDGVQALNKARENRPDLIILDLMLPKIDGLDVCRILRAESRIPIIMLTAKTTEDDKLIGLDLGADDYVTKPFSPRELLARVRAVLRRAAEQKQMESPLINAGNLEVDLIRHEVRLCGEVVHLTPREFRLLEILMRHPGRAFSRLDLLEYAFGYDYGGLERTVDVHIMNLRKKIEPDPDNPTYIQTVYGSGIQVHGASRSIKMFNSLRTRLLATLLIVVIVALGTIAFYISRTTTNEFERSLTGILRYRDPRLSSKIHNIEKTNLQYRGERDIWNRLQNQIEEMESSSQIRIVMADLDGKVYADSAGKLIGGELDTSLSKPFAVFLIEKIPILAYFEPLNAPNIQDIQYGFTSSVNRSLILAIIAAGSVTLLLTVLLSTSILRPISALTGAARELERGDLSQRVDVNARGELGELSKAFNAMADGLDRLERLRRNMVTDVAHELRTPLSNIRGYLEAIQDELMEPTPEMIRLLYEEAMTLNHLVDELQELALAEAGQLRMERSRVEVSEVVEKAVSTVNPQASMKGLTINTSIVQDIPPADTDPERLNQILRNLLNNAITYTPTNGQIKILVQEVGDQSRDQHTRYRKWDCTRAPALHL
jgi:DNA-binding response OmpR family regulator/signal transduction histidine kinase